MVTLVEVNRKAYLASIVPVIVNAILSEHQIIADIVAFVGKGDFPRSRLGEKQRGKILAGWVTRKLRTMAQFAIRDLDPAALNDGDGDPNRNSGSLRGSTYIGAGSSLRNVEMAPQIPEHEEYKPAQDRLSSIDPDGHNFVMPEDQKTPTGYPPQGPFGAPGDDYSHPSDGSTIDAQNRGDGGYGQPAPHTEFISELDSRPVTMTDDHYSAPSLSTGGAEDAQNFGNWDSHNPRISTDEEDWTADALMHMNLAGHMDSQNRRDRP